MKAVVGKALPYQRGVGYTDYCMDHVGGCAQECEFPFGGHEHGITLVSPDEGFMGCILLKMSAIKIICETEDR